MIVAVPNFAPMYASRARRVKTDRRDAQALMDVCRLGAYRPSHRVLETQRRVRPLLAVRDNLVRTRVRQVQLLLALLRREGLRPRPGQVANFAKRLDEVDTPLWLSELIAPVRVVMEVLNRELAELDRTLVEIVGDNPGSRGCAQRPASARSPRWPSSPPWTTFPASMEHTRFGPTSASYPRSSAPGSASKEGPSRRRAIPDSGGS